ncbi:MAG: transcriptional regulator [Acidiphilium sp. 37-64-53]|uniref:MerR family transcriptional regulator n=1 Tax=Acidiphilium sp. 37-64-53 TaxID=1970299 RepID=UPI000BCAF2A6|nr:helix-turn-helix domain-containing protein [Acidiphilium sp. 37-64-53]OYV99912.1 MAG: transcriptional regulator [Acidiphilium sp. 37-64-53]HQT89829.1 helix-turn-helix domain-containing protein [Acidiphilium sp.]
MVAGNMLIGEFSQRTGCAIETIRFYEKVGVLPEAQRRGRYRQYSASDVGRLIFVRRARELGFTLEGVRALLGLSALGSEACGEVRILAATHLADVRTRIADLRSMESILAQAVEQCDAGLKATCPLIDVLSAETAQRNS